MNKQLLTTTLFSMLVVSCAGAPSSNPIGSVSSSNNSTPTTSPSSSSSSSSSSSPQGSTTVVSSSITSSSSSSSSSTSQTPVNTKKVPFNQIGSLVAQVVDAKAMGVINSKDRGTLVGKRNSQTNSQNYIVKVTETYNSTMQITESESIQVIFTRVNNTVTTELQTRTETYLATASPLTIERLTDEPGNIVITNVEGHEYRLLSEGVVLEDWLSSDQPTITFTFNEVLPNITIESRSLNASVSFIAFEDFTYTIKQGETMIHEDIEDNDDVDTNSTVGNITISGLVEGLVYDVTYTGYQVVETITQDEVEGQVDKLYVLFQYTFISFVPLNLNQRPQDKDMQLDYDEVPLYDKQGYFSNTTRQSFVVDNDTGLIYKIENTHIESISKGIIWIKDNFVPHDMRIKANGDLEFFPLFTNTSIIAFDAFKDRHGNTFVFNNRLNFVDKASKTTFYVTYVKNWGPPNSQLQRIYASNFTQEQLNVAGFARGSTYWLTETNDALFVQADLDTPYSRFFWIQQVKLIDEQHERVDVPLDLEIKVYDFLNHDHNRTALPKPYRISNGKLMSETVSNNFFGFQPFKEWGEIAVYDLESKRNIYFELSGYPSTPWNPTYLIEKDILIEYTNGKLYAIYQFSDFLSQILEFTLYNLNQSGIFYLNWGFHSTLIGMLENPTNDFWKAFKESNTINLDYKLVLDDVGIVNGEVIKTGINGNTNYDLILEEIDGKPTLVAYVKGTYVAPPPTTITFQPINR
jgi:hypothetical protein